MLKAGLAVAGLTIRESRTGGLMLFRRRSEKMDALRKVPLFRDLGKSYLDLIARQADEADVAAGKVLVREGEQGLEFVLIAKGSARVERHGRVIAQLGPGEFFGEMSLLDGKPRSATVTAEEPSTLLVIHRRAMSPLLDTVPGLQRRMLMVLCQRLRDVQETI